MNLMQQRPKDFGICSKTIIYACFMGEVGMRRDQVITSPCAKMLGMFSTHDSCQSLQTDVESDTFDVEPVGRRFKGLENIPFLSVSSRIHPDGKTVDLFVVNRNLESDVESKIEWEGGDPNPDVIAWTLNGENIYDWNTFDEAEKTSVEESQWSMKDSEAVYLFPAHSITKLTFTLQ